MARVVAAFDRRHELAFLGLHDARAASLLAALPEEERLATWHLALVDGRVVGYGRGIVDLLRSLTLTRPLARLFERVPERWLERAYAATAKSRPRLGRLVPDRPGPTRYP